MRSRLASGFRRASVGKTSCPSGVALSSLQNEWCWIFSVSFQFVTIQCTTMVRPVFVSRPGLRVRPRRSPAGVRSEIATPPREQRTFEQCPIFFPICSLHVCLSFVSSLLSQFFSFHGQFSFPFNVFVKILPVSNCLHNVLVSISPLP